MQSWQRTAFVLSAAAALWAQGPPAVPPAAAPGTPGTPPPPNMPGAIRSIVKEFDADGDKQLNATERAAALAKLASEPRRGRFGGANRTDTVPAQPGPKLTQSQVKIYKNESLYDMNVLRTVFIDFDSAEWEKEMAAFNNTDVETLATVTIDGKVYKGVGVHFRGASSFGTVGAGYKRSMSLAFDHTNKDQRVLGYRAMNLLNSHNDPTHIRSVVYMQAAREYMPAPKVNYVRVVINGESWGVYPSAQQYNAEFVRDFYKTGKGARWRVPGSPSGRGGFKYLGENVEDYKRIYSLRSKDSPEEWAALINLTKVLTETPADQLEAKLEPILDVEGALRWLAIEKTLVNSDGYWIRMSDYSMYRDVKGKFHIMPHDANETLGPVEGPGGGPPRPPAPAGSAAPTPPPPPPAAPTGPPRPVWPRDGSLDLMAGAQDPNKVMFRLMEAPKLRARYIALCQEIAKKWLDWQYLGGLADKYQGMIKEDVLKDTRKLGTNEEFTKALLEETPGPMGAMGMKPWADARRAYVLSYKDPGVSPVR